MKKPIANDDLHGTRIIRKATPEILASFGRWGPISRLVAVFDKNADIVYVNPLYYDDPVWFNRAVFMDHPVLRVTDRH